MDSTLTDALDAIDAWLDELTILEESYNRSHNTLERMDQTFVRLQHEGELTAEIDYIGTLWRSLIELLMSNVANQEMIIRNALLLFQVGAITLDFCQVIITHQCMYDWRTDTEE